MARILVTGAAGLIGSHLVDYLIDQGHTVFGVDNLSIGTMDNVSQKARKNFWQLDLRNKENVEFAMRTFRPDVVYAAAAWAHEGLAQFTPRLITENNTNIFLNTLIPAVRTGMKRIVVFSSVAVYGDQEPPFTEETPAKPDDIYALNKSFIEQATKILSDVHGFDYTIVRAFNVFGERQVMSDPYRGVAAIFMNKLLHGEPFVIYGDGEQQRGFTYVHDAVPAIAQCGFAEEAKGQVFNIGGSQVYSVNELANTILEVAGSDLKPEHLPARVKDVKIAYCDTSKAKRMLGLKDETSLKDALTHMWNWAKEQGPQEPKYLKYLEMPSPKVPANWIRKEDK